MSETSKKNIVQRYNNQRPIILIGMMGCGKSHIGRILSKALDLRLCDLDQEIESKAGLSIPQIFEDYGEEAFRDFETKTLHNVLEEKSVVISTGGGAVIRDENLKAMLTKGIVIWIKADANAIYERIKKNRNRPLLQCDDPKQKISALLQEREGFYEQAHIQIDNSKNNPQKTLSALTDALNTYLSK